VLCRAEEHPGDALVRAPCWTSRAAACATATRPACRPACARPCSPCPTAGWGLGAARGGRRRAALVPCRDLPCALRAGEPVPSRARLVCRQACRGTRCSHVRQGPCRICRSAGSLVLGAQVGALGEVILRGRMSCRALHRVLQCTLFTQLTIVRCTSVPGTAGLHSVCRWEEQCGAEKEEVHYRHCSHTAFG